MVEIVGLAKQSKHVFQLEPPFMNPYLRLFQNPQPRHEPADPDGPTIGRPALNRAATWSAPRRRAAG
jgi:hypothetical protein